MPAATITYTTRAAVSSDLERLVRFTLAEAGDAEGAAKDASRVRAGVLAGLEDDTIARYWVLEADGIVIGSVSVVREWSDWHGGYYWWVQSMYIEDAYRGRGLMKCLLAAVTQAASDESALELRLYVHRNNTTAISAYKKAGFADSHYQIMTMDIGKSEAPPLE